MVTAGRRESAVAHVRNAAPEPVDSREVEAFISELENDLPGRKPDREPTLAEQIDRLERKLDLILSLLDPGRPRPLDESIGDL